jgi:hypothetical protein
MNKDGWAGMPEELFEKVLEALQPDGPSKPQDGGLRFSQALAAVRMVCSGWQAVHDVMVTRLVLREQATDEAVGMLVRRFPAVEVTGSAYEVAALTDTTGLRAVSICTALKTLNLWACIKVTDEGVRAVSSCTALTSLNLRVCRLVTDEGMRALSSLPALTSLHLSGCFNVTAAGVQALRSTTAAPTCTSSCSESSSASC